MISFFDLSDVSMDGENSKEQKKLKDVDSKPYVKTSKSETCLDETISYKVTTTTRFDIARLTK